MKKPRAPKLVTVAITTTITIIFWIFFTLYQVLVTKPSPSVDPKLLEPIDAYLNTGILDQLDNKNFFEEGSFTPPKVSAPEVQPENQVTVQTASPASQKNQ